MDRLEDQPRSSHRPGRAERILALILSLPIRAYRRLLSPLLPPACRYHPSCSVYAIQALDQHGPLRGAWLTLGRLARCHPWGGHGLDPVPPPLPPDPRRPPDASSAPSSVDAPSPVRS